METPVVPPNTEFNSTVYDPAEDSFLLLDALEEDLPKYFSDIDGKPGSPDKFILTLEVGCGSGIISTALAKYQFLQDRLAGYVIATDVNPNACLLTQKTAQVNGAGNKVETLLLDGKTCANLCLRLPFDLIVCNPPYVPILPGENSEDEQSGILEKSWDGGPDGNEFIIPFLKNVGSLLAPNGALYLLLSSWNKPEFLMEDIAKAHGLTGALIIKRNAGRERLSVWRLTKSKTTD